MDATIIIATATAAIVFEQWPFDSETDNGFSGHNNTNDISIFFLSFSANRQENLIKRTFYIEVYWFVSLSILSIQWMRRIKIEIVDRLDAEGK